MRERQPTIHVQRLGAFFLFAAIILLISAPAAGQQPSGDRDIEIPVTDVRVIGREVRVDIAYDTKFIELLETLEKDLARLLKKAAENFPDSATIRILISNRGEKVCELETPTEAAAKAARNALSDDAMLAQTKSELYIDLKGRIDAEQKPEEWPRFSSGSFEENLLASLMEDEWKALEENPAEEAEEGGQGEIGPGKEGQGLEIESAAGEDSKWWAESEDQAGKSSGFPSIRTALLVLAAVVLMIVAALFIRKRRIK